MADGIVVSVICNAYNHAPYIRACLEGLVAQRTRFPFEILAHDDASSDGTADILREFAGRYPGLVLAICEAENQYSRGNLNRIQYGRVRGKYVAFCEGDDLWTDPLKLQKQVDALEAHPQIDICAHAADRIDGVTGRRIAAIAPSHADAVFTAEEVILGGGMFVATSSLMIRSALNGDIPEFRRRRRTDYTLQIHGALRGGMLYLSDNMSVYRYRSPGSWSGRMGDAPERKRGFTARVTEMLRQLDVDTQRRYHDAIALRIRQYEFQQHIHDRDFRALLGAEYADCLARLPLHRRCGVRLCAAMPGAYALWARARAFRAGRLMKHERIRGK